MQDKKGDPVDENPDRGPEGSHGDSGLGPLERAWQRVHEHKVLQWGLAYLGAALALAHGTELLSHTFHWPETANRLVMGVLIVGFPLVLALSWYHGHKGLTRISKGEMMVVSLLLVISAGLLILFVRVPNEHDTEAASRPAESEQH